MVPRRHPHQRRRRPARGHPTAELHGGRAPRRLAPLVLRVGGANPAQTTAGGARPHPPRPARGSWSQPATACVEHLFEGRALRRSRLTAAELAATGRTRAAFANPGDCDRDRAIPRQPWSATSGARSSCSVHPEGNHIRVGRTSVSSCRSARASTASSCSGGRHPRRGRHGHGARRCRSG